MTWSNLTSSIDNAVFSQLRDESEVIQYLFIGGGSSTIPAVVLGKGTRRDVETGISLYYEAAFVVQSGAFTSTQPQVGDSVTHGGNTFLVANFDAFGDSLTLYGVTRAQQSRSTADSGRLTQ